MKTMFAAWVLAGRYGLMGLIAAPVIGQAPFTYWWTVRACWRELRE